MRFARSERIADGALRESVERAEKGLIDADLGGGVIKQRVARPGEGKSGGFRSIVLLRTKERAVFAYGFAKKSRDNIRRDELQAFKMLAEEMLGYDNDDIAKAVAAGALQEVDRNGQEDDE